MCEMKPDKYLAHPANSGVIGFAAVCARLQRNLTEESEDVIADVEHSDRIDQFGGCNITQALHHRPRYNHFQKGGRPSSWTFQIWHLGRVTVSEFNSIYLFYLFI